MESLTRAEPRHAARGLPGPPQSEDRRAGLRSRQILGLQQAVGNRVVAMSLVPVVQRDPKPNPARARVLAAMADLQKKYRLDAVTEGPGRSWTLEELKFVDRAFAKMSKVERRNLRGLTLTRVKELFQMRDGKKEPLAGRATGGALIELSDLGMKSVTVPLHEAGHIIQTRALLEEERQLRDSPVGRSLDRAVQNLAAAMKRLPPTMSFSGQHAEQIRDFAAAINRFNTAGSALMNSGPEDDVTELQDALLAADVDAYTQRQLVQGYTTQAWVPQLLLVHDRQRDWEAAIGAWMSARAQRVGSRRDYREFVDIVTRNRLARRTFAPFTSYVQRNWPNKPGEFFAESYATYRDRPDYLKRHALELFTWFERGGHLAPLSPARAALEDVRDDAPVIGELADEFIGVFGGIRQLSDLIPGSRP